MKVLVDLPNHCGTNGESMWARPLGDNLYELHNSPFYAYDLNYLDVVFALSDDPSMKPLVLRIERRSGHRTLRVILLPATPPLERTRILALLNESGATYENANSRLYSLDVRPDKSYDLVCEKLLELETAGLLEYETCEARVVGSFDGNPNSS